MSYNPLPRHVRLALWAAIVLGFVVCLSGCITRDGRSQTQETETTTTERPAFAPDGTPFVEVSKTTRVRSSQTEDSQTTTIQVPPVVGAVVSAAVTGAGTGGVGTLAALAVSLVTTAGAGVAAILKAREANFHKADAAEGWAKAEAKGAV